MRMNGVAEICVSRRYLNPVYERETHLAADVVVTWESIDVGERVFSNLSPICDFNSKHLKV